MTVKLGKLPAQSKKSDFQLAKLLSEELPKPPGKFGNEDAFPNWGMLGNGRYDDCAWAGAAHETMLWDKLLSRPVTQFTTKTCLADYAAVTSFDPKTGKNDSGTHARDMMSYRRKTGIIDAKGVRHKIDAYVAIDPRDWDTMIRAARVFGVVGIGFRFPDSAEDEFDNSRIWQPSSAKIMGAHYVPVVGTRSSTKEATCITWGRRQRLSREFYEKYNDESWIPLSFEVLRSGYGLDHIDLPKLKTYLAALSKAK
jgi:hypothetical protein